MKGRRTESSLAKHVQIHLASVHFAFETENHSGERADVSEASTFAVPLPDQQNHRPVQSPFAISAVLFWTPGTCIAHIYVLTPSSPATAPSLTGRNLLP